MTERNRKPRVIVATCKSEQDVAKVLKIKRDLRKCRQHIVRALKALSHYNVLANVCRRMKYISSTLAYAEILLKIRGSPAL